MRVEAACASAVLSRRGEPEGNRTLTSAFAERNPTIEPAQYDYRRVRRPGIEPGSRSWQPQILPLNYRRVTGELLERIAGIEPAFCAWKTLVLPLDDTRKNTAESKSHPRGSNPPFPAYRAGAPPSGPEWHSWWSKRDSNSHHPLARRRHSLCAIAPNLQPIQLAGCEGIEPSRWRFGGSAVTMTLHPKVAERARALSASTLRLRRESNPRSLA